jgi:hypothetical protein
MNLMAEFRQANSKDTQRSKYAWAKEMNALKTKFIILIVSVIILFESGAYAEEVSSETNESSLFHEAYREASIILGPFYTLSLEEKADFYNKYVYHNVGTRRGVPDERHVDIEVIKKLAVDYLCSFLDCGEVDLPEYIPDVDFWVEVNMPDFDEHEYYTVCFLNETNDGNYENVYQLMISAYSGSLIELLDIRQLTTE